MLALGKRTTLAKQFGIMRNSWSEPGLTSDFETLKPALISQKRKINSPRGEVVQEGKLLTT